MAKHTLKIFQTSQNVYGMFGHFSILCMKELIARFSCLYRTENNPLEKLKNVTAKQIAESNE